MTAPSSIGSKGQHVGLQAEASSLGGGSFYPSVEGPPADLDFEPGDVVAGRHVIQYYLTDSPLATLYVARHASVPSLAYVMKVLKREFAAIPEVVEQFRVEATSIAQLRDPHSVRITDMGLLPDGRPFICREFCRGIGLPQLMERFGPLPTTLVHRIALGVLSSLSEAHDLGVIHRDIRPLGLILTEEIATGDVRCRVLDFGTAHIDTSSRLFEHTRATNPSIMMCAPQYASPELLRGKVAKSVDTYALGLTLAELLEGKPVVEAGPFLQVAYAQLAETEWSLGEKASSSPLAGIIRKAIRKAPEERYADAGEMLDDLLRNYPVSYGHYEILWTRWSAIGEGLVVTPRPAIHSAKTLSPRSQNTGDQPAILLEEAHDVLLNELPTAQRMAAVNDDALFASVDRISQNSEQRGERESKPSQDSADLLLSRSSLFPSDSMVDSDLGTQRVRRPSFTQELPSADEVNSRSSTDFGRLAILRSMGDQGLSRGATHLRLPALNAGDKLRLPEADPFEPLGAMESFSMEDFVDVEHQEFAAWDDFEDDSLAVNGPFFALAAPPAGETEEVIRRALAAPLFLGGYGRRDRKLAAHQASPDEFPNEPSSPSRRMTAEEAIAALGTTPTDPEALEEFVSTVKNLRRIEAKQNLALMIRGALITVLVVLILWTIANVVS